jgi:hypothetical protein
MVNTNESGRLIGRSGGDALFFCWTTLSIEAVCVLLFRYIAVSRSAEDPVIVGSDARAAARRELFILGAAPENHQRSRGLADLPFQEEADVAIVNVKLSAAASNLSFERPA